MPKHMTLGSVVEKNKIASKNAFVMLAEIEVRDIVTGNYVETIYLANNNEDVTHDGQTYSKSGFSIEFEETSDGVPDVTCEFQDPSGSVISKCEAHAGGVGWKVRFKLVNPADPNQPAEIEELVYIVATKASTYAVEFTLGARNPLAQRFPRDLQWRDKCRWIFKGPICGYAGGATVCDYTLQGANGCSVKNNSHRFGGLPGLRPRG